MPPKTMFAAILAITASPLAAAPSTPPPDARLPQPQVSEIAQMLSPGPLELAPPATNREYWSAVFAKDAKSAKRAIRAAEKALAEPLPDPSDDLYKDFFRTGNRMRYQKVRTALLIALGKLTRAEELEGKGRFAAKTCECLERILAMKSWILPAHDRKTDMHPEMGTFNGTHKKIDLVSSATARTLARRLRSLEGTIPAELHARVRNAIEERVFAIYRDAVRNAERGKTSKGCWWFFGKNNWNAVCHAGTVEAALTILEDRNDRALFVRGALLGIPHYIGGFTPEGYCTEGIGYWTYGFGEYLKLGFALRKATGGKIDIFAAPRAKAAMRYALEYRIQPGVAPLFADGVELPSRKLLEEGCSVWPDLRPLIDAALPERTEFTTPQVYILRANAGAPLGIGLKGGNNAEMHNHNDVGSYNIALDGAILAGDPGPEVYTARTFSSRRYESKVLNSWGHPVPVVDGCMQSRGAKAAGKVVATNFTAEADTVSIDISAAYDVPALKSLVRTFTLDRKSRTIEIRDEVRFSSPSRFSDPFVTVADLEQISKDAFRIASPGDGKMIDLEVRASAGWTLEPEDIDNPGRRTPKRRAVTLDAPVSAATVSFKFSAK